MLACFERGGVGICRARWMQIFHVRVRGVQIPHIERGYGCWHALSEGVLGCVEQGGCKYSTVPLLVPLEQSIYRYLFNYIS